MSVVTFSFKHFNINTVIVLVTLFADTEEILKIIPPITKFQYSSTKIIDISPCNDRCVRPPIFTNYFKWIRNALKCMRKISLEFMT